MLHKVGDDPKKDICIFSRINNPELGLEKLDWAIANPIPQNPNMLVYTTTGSSQFMTIYKLDDKIENIKNPSLKWKLIFSKDELISNFVIVDNDLFVISSKTNPNGCLLKYNINKLGDNPIIIEDAKNEVLEELVQTNESIYLKKNKNGVNTLVKIHLKSLQKDEINLPFYGNISFRASNSINSNKQHSNRLYFAMESWVNEIGVYYYDPLNNNIVKTDLRPKGTGIDLSDLKVTELEIESFDGTQVPLTIMHSSNLKLNGKNPTIIEGYGAYGVSINSTYDPARIAWVKLGGIYAIAHVRGGGEKGNAWHKGGFKANKSNCWNDFISCTEYLNRMKYTSAKNIAARGISSGAITIGRAITEKPNLFKACLLEVGALNTVRNNFRSNTMSEVEYGKAEDSTEFDYLYNMDVYHHIKLGVKYPALLITAGLNDSRVELWQPAKAVARFQEYATKNSLPILFKISEKGGHMGELNSVKKYTDFYSFLLSQLKKKTK